MKSSRKEIGEHSEGREKDAQLQLLNDIFQAQQEDQEQEDQVQHSVLTLAMFVATPELEVDLPGTLRTLLTQCSATTKMGTNSSNQKSGFRGEDVGLRLEGVI